MLIDAKDFVLILKELTGINLEDIVKALMEYESFKIALDEIIDAKISEHVGDYEHKEREVRESESRS